MILFSAMERRPSLYPPRPGTTVDSIDLTSDEHALLGPKDKLSVEQFENNLYTLELDPALYPTASEFQ